MIRRGLITLILAGMAIMLIVALGSCFNANKNLPNRIQEAVPLTCQQYLDILSEFPDEGWAPAFIRFHAPSTCRAAIRNTAKCWRMSDATLCRHGRHYGPGLGGVNADGSPATCTPTVGLDVPVPCVSAFGQGWSQRMRRYAQLSGADKTRMRRRFLRLVNGRLKQRREELGL